MLDCTLVAGESECPRQQLGTTAGSFENFVAQSLHYSAGLGMIHSCWAQTYWDMEDFLALTDIEFQMSSAALACLHCPGWMDIGY
jgi:hypothetical protein